MERSERLNFKVDSLSRTVTSLAKLMNRDLSIFDEIISDGIMNGRIQKFEYCTKLLWKTIREFLLIKEGIDAKSPKAAIKEFFIIGYTEQKDYQLLFEMLHDRNSLSHIYKEDYFKEVHSKLGDYLIVMQKILKILEDSLNYN